jgi:predicted ArsR family transcriptional regulator
VSDADAVAQSRALGSPSRRAIVTYLTTRDEPVTVADLTTHLGLHHNAVRKHLTQLVAAGLILEGREQRDTAGRPRLLYRLAPQTAAGQERAYRRLAVLLAETMASGDDPAVVGRRAGVDSATASVGGLDALVERFAVDGFEPAVRRRDGRAEVVLGSCPFADAAAANPDVVCRLHLGLAEGIADRVGGVQVDGLTPSDPYRAGCRVAVSDT